MDAVPREAFRHHDRVDRKSRCSHPTVFLSVEHVECFCVQARVMEQPHDAVKHTLKTRQNSMIDVFKCAEVIMHE